MLDVSVRPVRIDECAQVSGILRSSFVWADRQDLLPSTQYLDFVFECATEEAICAKAEWEQFLVAEQNERLVGFVAIKDAEVTELFADPDHLRQGIGRTLFKAAEAEICSAGHSELRLYTVFPSSLPFYRAVGLQLLGEGRVAFGPLEGLRNFELGKRIDGQVKTIPVSA